MSRRPALRGKRKFRQQFHRDILEVDDNSFLWEIPVALGCYQVSGYILNLHNESWKSAMCFFISPTIAVMSIMRKGISIVSPRAMQPCMPSRCFFKLKRSNQSSFYLKTLPGTVFFVSTSRLYDFVFFLILASHLREKEMGKLLFVQLSSHQDKSKQQVCK